MEFLNCAIVLASAAAAYYSNRLCCESPFVNGYVQAPRLNIVVTEASGLVLIKNCPPCSWWINDELTTCRPRALSVHKCSLARSFSSASINTW
ncbi:hypothetical protein BO78DRAFT_218918 [Aspergillus sclerotiicarbonarius CBS 121057]|uniref:Secreted protein n=1 Tax=Aspergillus sclerotiicarbonarius (strain CBS 121057 / IBT 28362) TaxID=1448318 RepID=A0A319EJ74_ASPSB|nr:hypothetical protein BO78DRAFT_218918 [Aspergillus sclerotiicarbonarius CBS 121057]